MKKRIIFQAIFWSIMMGMMLVTPAYAKDPKPTIRDTGYAARFVSQSTPDPVVMEAGETKNIDIVFKNIGTKTWDGSSARYLSAYTMEPRYRISPFLQDKQSNPIAGVVKPGKTGTLSLTLTAPNEPGEYVERFYLAAENYSWVEGSYFFLKITVVPATPKVVEPETVGEGEADEVEEEIKIQASLLDQSKKQVKSPGGKLIPLLLIYKNIGTTEWAPYTIVTKKLEGVSIADKKWYNSTTVGERNFPVKPGAKHREYVNFRAPEKAGEYIATFQLAQNGALLPNTEAEVRIHVTENAPVGYVAPDFGDSEDAPLIATEKPRLDKEPMIRVGLTGEGETIQIVSYEDDYVLIDGLTNEPLGELPKKHVAIIMVPEGGGSWYSSGKTRFTTPSYFRLEPKNKENAVFTVMKGLKDRSMAWVGPGKFQKYRGAVEVRRGETDKKVYVVNELLLEDYVEGISETGKGTNIEAVKANLVAARTYAYLSKGKYPFFDVLGSTYDQLYLGDDVKKNLTDVAAAAQATRGQMVTYKDEIVMTPYFGNSSGVTRAWHQVWGGSLKPWLVPVKAKYDAGRRRFGHGVGMSQRDAARRAKHDGWDYTQLLSHYYTGTDVDLIYK